MLHFPPVELLIVGFPAERLTLREESRGVHVCCAPCTSCLSLNLPLPSVAVFCELGWLEVLLTKNRKRKGEKRGSVCLSVCLPACLPVCLPVYLPV